MILQRAGRAQPRTIRPGQAIDAAAERNSHPRRLPQTTPSEDEAVDPPDVARGAEDAGEMLLQLGAGAEDELAASLPGESSVGDPSVELPPSPLHPEEQDSELVPQPTVPEEEEEEVPEKLDTQKQILAQLKRMADGMESLSGNMRAGFTDLSQLVKDNRTSAPAKRVRFEGK